MILGAVPLDVSIQVAQVALRIPIFFAWAVSGVETSLVFVPASASVSEFVERSAMEEDLLRGGEKQHDLIEKFVVDGVRFSDDGVVPKELQGIAAKLFNREEVLKLPKQLFALVNEDLFVGADNFEALLESFDFFFGIFQRILDIEDFVVDLVHAVCEGAYI